MPTIKEVNRLAKLAPKREHTIEEYKAAIQRSMGLLSYVAKELGLTYEAVRQRVRKNPELQAMVEHYREELVDLSELTFRKKLQEYDVDVAKFIASRTLAGRRRGYGVVDSIGGVETDTEALTNPIRALAECIAQLSPKEAKEVLGVIEAESGGRKISAELARGNGHKDK